MNNSERQKFPINTDVSSSLNFLYKTTFGRVILKILTRPFVSKTAGFFMNRKISTLFIKSFIKNNGIDMSDYESEKYSCFNNFFTRHIIPEKRPVAQSGLISPCDSLLTVYDIDENTRFSIKGRTYNTSELLGGDEISKDFLGGKCLVFRLTVHDYHRYCYIDDGMKDNNIFLKGVLHTVQPIACGEFDVYKENCREYTVMRTNSFGTVVQVEVGAMMVGKICNNHNAGGFTRGMEKGRFEFGGSTIVLLLKKGAAEIDKEIIENTANGFETRVKYGEKIGKALSR